VLLLLALGGVARADALAEVERAQQALYEKIGPSVVFIATRDAFGSGFFVDKQGLILTNAHVVTGQNTVRVVLADGRSMDGEVVERARDDIDLALVHVPVTSVPLQMADRGELRVGAWVASVGHGRGGIWSFNSGMISNIYPDGTGRPVFQTQIPLNPGNSGGPVVDRSGRVVGVVTAALKDSQNINFAIRIQVALQSFSKLAAACDCLSIRAPIGVPIFVDGKMVGTGPHVAIAAEKRSYEVFAVINGAMKKMQVHWPATRFVDLRQ
jgi:S1-C subfamily serine protease